MDSDASRNQLGVTRVDFQWSVEASTQIQASGAIGGVGRQVFVNACIEDLQSTVVMV